MPLGQLRGRWLLKRGSGWTRWRGPRPVHTPLGPSATCPRKDCLPQALLQAQHLWLLIYFRPGTSSAGGVLCSKWGGCSSWRRRRDQGQVGCRYFMSPCPGVTVSQPLLHAMAAVWSPWPWRGPVPVEWSPCPWRGLPCPWHGLPCPWCGLPCPWHSLPCPWCDFHVCGVVSVAMVSPSPWHGLRVCGVIFRGRGMVPCPRRGLRLHGVVSVPMV